MIQVLHIAAECYPAAKTGGLGDVVGSLPKYLTGAGVLAGAVLPKYALKWIHNQEWVQVYSGAIRVDWRHIGFTVQQQRSSTLGYPLFVVDVPGLYDRPGIYNDPSGWPYEDELERYLVFQQAVLQWVISFPPEERPKVLHCHDHHTGLIPFMVKYCPEYRALEQICTVFTIHNGQYQGAFSWSKLYLLPFFDSWGRSYLDWNNTINPMASAIKCAWAVTTVSNSYLLEMHQSSLGLEPLLRHEWRKEHGIINGIDAQVWDPATDSYIKHRFTGDVTAFKRANKQQLCEWFGLPMGLPLVSFIGRIVREKGADILPDTFKRYIELGGQCAFLVLGSGESWTENEFKSMAYHYRGRFNAVIDYNEGLSHQIYAGSDFLIMPSRVEPCGLNQMYSMRYGTVPIVRATGGLKDSVPDVGEPDGSGCGFRFEQFSVDDAFDAIYRASSYYQNPEAMHQLRTKIMSLDFSWETQIQRYISLYKILGAQL